MRVAQGFSRRRFLKETAYGSFLLFFAKVIPSSALHAQNVVPEGLRFFSRHEYLVMKAIGERIIGISEADRSDSPAIDEVMRADRFLAEEDPEIQGQFHQLLTVFSSTLFTFLFDFRFSRFLDMNPEDKDSYLEDWMTSSLAFRRKGFQALKRTCMSMYYTDPRSWSAIGFHGMFLPEDRS
jgi:hypothetical protein